MMRTRQKQRVATGTWISLGCRITPLGYWGKRKPTVELTVELWLNAYFIYLETIIREKSNCTRNFGLGRRWKFDDVAVVLMTSFFRAGLALSRNIQY